MKTKKEIELVSCCCDFSRQEGRKEALKEVLEIVKNVNEEDYKYIEFKIREMMEK